MQQREWIVEFVVCHRDTNLVADCLAKEASSMGSDFVAFIEPPGGIHHLLLRDRGQDCYMPGTRLPAV